MHSDDLGSHDLRAGDIVTVTSNHGETRALIAADDTMRRGVVSMTHGWGRVGIDDPLVGGSSTSLLICSDRDVEHINGMPRMSGIPVTIRRCIR
jgi:anaerobic selenocysteine-containing dehydrogenase